MTSPPLPKTSSLLSLSLPERVEDILVVTLNRPAKLNAIPMDGHMEMAEIWSWMDEQPQIRCGILTGMGKAFCAGADLEEWASGPDRPVTPSSGFGGLSRRYGKKPVIAAVNGLCLGGGFEMVVNADLVLATSKASFQLPEAQVGVVALAGALPRLARTVGKQRATELAITGRSLTAGEAMSWGLVNQVIDNDGDLMSKAVEMAKKIIRCSPDSVIISRRGIMKGWEGAVAEGEDVVGELCKKVEGNENHREGMRAWAKREQPRWSASKL